MKRLIITTILTLACTSISFSSVFSEDSESTSIKTPIYTYERNTSYYPSESEYDKAYIQKLEEFRNNTGYYNPANGSYEKSSSTHSFGGNALGFGATHTETNQPNTTSAAEEALHTWERTEPFRQLNRQFDSSSSGKGAQ